MNMEEEQSVENTLKSVKKLITSPSKGSDSNEEILELTEDDLFDELDEDYQDDGAIPKKEKKNFSINQFLTSIDNNNKSADHFEQKTENDLDESVEEKVISEEVAAQSAANIRNIIKKMEMPMENNVPLSSNSNLERIIMDSLKPYLEEWLEQNVTNIIKKEVKDAISKQNKKNE
jgi:cell pole-organizing protein PopZ